MGGLKNEAGKRYGKLTVIKKAKNHINTQAKWLCECDCGKFTVTTGTNLRKGITKSCGCIQKEFAKKLNKKHGKFDARLYRIWGHMIDRCYNKSNRNYKNYGKRGIKVCEKWVNSYINFYDWAINNGYKKELTIERIDNDKGYEENNCKWATRKEQGNNTRRNRIVKINGEKLTLSQASKKYNISYSTICSRYHRSGWRGNDLIKEVKTK